MSQKEQQFDDSIKETIDSCIKTLIIKGKEYRRNNNPFHNFEVGSRITNQSREDIIWSFAIKHFISIQDIKNDLKNGIIPSKEILDEKYGDLINYLLIEKASILDKING
jgi:hypothetical protein